MSLRSPRRDLAAPTAHSGGFSRKIRGGRFVLGQSGSAAFPAASGAYCWLREPIRPGSSQSAPAHSRTMFKEAELINNWSVRDVNKGRAWKVSDDRSTERLRRSAWH